MLQTQSTGEKGLNIVKGQANQVCLLKSSHQMLSCNQALSSTINNRRLRVDVDLAVHISIESIDIQIHIDMEDSGLTISFAGAGKFREQVFITHLFVQSRNIYGVPTLSYMLNLLYQIFYLKSSYFVPFQVWVICISTILAGSHRFSILRVPVPNPQIKNYYNNSIFMESKLLNLAFNILVTIPVLLMSTEQK